jgi:hypothetical protein
VGGNATNLATPPRIVTNIGPPTISFPMTSS